MRMNNVGNFVAEPAVETDPAARIGQALAHFEAQKSNAGAG